MAEMNTVTVDSASEIQALRERIALLESKTVMTTDDLAFQGYTDDLPVTPQQQYAAACSNDVATINFWRDKWLDNTKKNAVKHDFNAESAMDEYAKCAMRPCICAGSGPSLKRNVDILAAKKKGKDIGLVSCLHNFGLFVDKNIDTDYFVSLDAGEITVPEVGEFGTRDAQYYWDATKDHTLVASVMSHPDLVSKWQGKIRWFSPVVPDGPFLDEYAKITNFVLPMQTGGNALGAAFYFSKAILGATPNVFIGADFSFDYSRRFHPVNTRYDAMYAGLIPVTDVFGHRRYTWHSYKGFAEWLVFQSRGGQGNHIQLLINCTEGGILGAYPHGNIRTILQMRLDEFFDCYTMYKVMPEIVADPQKKLGFVF